MLCDETNKTLAELESFLPDLGAISGDLKAKAHNSSGRPMSISNQNNNSYENLSKEEIEIIRSELGKRESIINFYPNFGQ